MNKTDLIACKIQAFIKEGEKDWSIWKIEFFLARALPSWLVYTGA